MNYVTHDVEQGTLDWMLLRIGIPTASRADSLLTPKTRKPSGGRGRYRAELLAEWMLGQPLDSGSSGFMQRGTDMESEARRFYELQYDVEIEQVGFITREDGLCGCSPDGLIHSDGLLEIKVPGALQHVQYMLGDEPDYIGQVNFQMYITERSWCDVISYNPELPSVIYRVERDEGYLKAFVPVLDEFIGTLTEQKERLAEHRVTRPWDMEVA